MAYIGNIPAEAYISISSQTFTTINGTGYTLSSSVTNSEDIALLLNNVRQKPSTYTATGTSLTMSSPTTTADELYCVYLGKGIQTVTPGAASVGTAQIADDAVTYAKIQDTTTANRVIGAATAGVVSEVQVVDDMTNFVSTASAPGLTVKGDSTTDGTLQLNCSQNSHGVKIKSPAHSAAKSYNLTLPATAPAADKYFQTDGSGNLSWVDVNVGDIAWQAVTTAATLSAVAGRGYPIDTTSNACTVTLPASASVGDQIIFTDYLRTWATYGVTLNQNSLNFQGNTSPNPQYKLNGESVHIVYMDATQGWIPINDGAVSMETAQSYTVDFLVIGGGGAGGYDQGGAGGAGGYRTSFGTSGGGASAESSLTFSTGTVYTATIGDGGVGVGTNAARAESGDDTTLSGSDITNVVSAGGGGGGVYDFTTGSAKQNGDPGGSGGGGGGYVGSGGAGTANQGYAGGNAATLCGGGGGGASSVGVAAVASSSAGNGGAGVSSTITGASVARAGGGGGACTSSYTPGTASDGGGAGTNSTSVAPGDGSANTGGGGGGAWTGQDGGNGGTGVVILSMPDGNYSGNTTGSPTVAVDVGGTGKTTVTFTGDGTYTA